MGKYIERNLSVSGDIEPNGSRMQKKIVYITENLSGFFRNS